MGRIICLLVVLLLAGCGGGDDGRIAAAAANAIEPQLRTVRSDAYAGYVIEEDRLIVYRKPDAHLEIFVRDRLRDLDVEVEFRDAPYSLSELQPLADRVAGERRHWSARQITATTVSPRPDGTGVDVTVPADDLEAVRAALRQRYGDEPIVVRTPAKTGIVPAG